MPTAADRFHSRPTLLSGRSIRQVPIFTGRPSRGATHVILTAASSTPELACLVAGLSADDATRIATAPSRTDTISRDSMLPWPIAVAGLSVGLPVGPPGRGAELS